jgi:flavorubredoxin
MAITNKDIEKMKEVFVTKDEFGEFKCEMKEFKSEMKEFKSEMKEFKNEVLKSQDIIIGQLEKIREDRVFAKAKDDELERRIEKVEAKVF